MNEKCDGQRLIRAHETAAIDTFEYSADNRSAVIGIPTNTETADAALARVPLPFFVAIRTMMDISMLCCC